MSGFTGHRQLSLVSSSLNCHTHFKLSRFEVVSLSATGGRKASMLVYLTSVVASLMGRMNSRPRPSTSVPEKAVKPISRPEPAAQPARGGVDYCTTVVRLMKPNI